MINQINASGKINGETIEASNIKETKKWLNAYLAKHHYLLGNYDLCASYLSESE